MKASVLTWYHVANHGAVLQAYALCEELRALGAEPSLCEFKRASERHEGAKKRTGLRKIIRPDFFHMLHEVTHKDRIAAFKREKRTQLDDFIQNHLCVLSRESLNGADVTVVGSDEVFSLETGFTPELFGFGYDCPRIFSYAASAGSTTFEDVKKYELTDKLHTGLQRFRSISVRDRNTADLVSRLTGTVPQIVLDPVLLYGFKREQQAASPVDTGKCVAVYAYHGRMNDAQEVSEIRSYSKNNSHSIVSLCFYHGWCDDSVNLPPFETLSAIRQASFVVTDTFHGAVFCLITHTPFAMITRPSNHNKISSLLADFDLDDRILKKGADLASVAARPIDFRKTDSIISRKRESSRRFLSENM